MPLLRTVPGIAWVLAYTIASEIGDISRFPTPRKLIGYTGLCPRVYQSGETDRRGALSKHGPDYLRWALIEAAHTAVRYAPYRQPVERHRVRHGRRRGSAIAAVTIALKLTEAIWWSSPATSRLLRQAPRVLDRPTVPKRIAPPEQAPIQPDRPPPRAR